MGSKVVIPLHPVRQSWGRAVVIPLPLVLLVLGGICLIVTVHAVVGAIVVFCGLVLLAVVGYTIHERLYPPLRRLEFGPDEVCVFDGAGTLLARGQGVWRPGIHDPGPPALPESRLRPWPAIGLTVASLPEMILRADLLAADWPQRAPHLTDPEFIVSDADWPRLLAALRA